MSCKVVLEPHLRGFGAKAFHVLRLREQTVAQQLHREDAIQADLPRTEHNAHAATGSPFPAGDTLVRCVATDACGNTNVCSFTVTVTNCLSCDPSLTRHDPDAPPGRALIKGRIQFGNSNPEILARLSVAAPSDQLQVQLNGVSATTRTYKTIPRPAGPPSMDYDLVVEAEPVEAQPG